MLGISPASHPMAADRSGGFTSPRDERLEANPQVDPDHLTNSPTDAHFV